MPNKKNFLTLAIELSMIPAEAVENLSREAASSGEAIETLVARRGLLSPVQMDVVQTLVRPSEVIPGYELLSLIGHGGMGVVYRARQRTLDRIVAIKTILVSQMSDPKFATRFEQEARAVAKLHHPNIINAIDFGQHDGRLFFVMELVEGQDVETSLQGFSRDGLIGRRAEELAWCLAKQTAAGLAHAADAGIVHRDIKPANLLLIDPPAGFPLPPGMPLVKIADFGLAFLTTEADVKTRVTAANTAVGSPHYMAPEQLGGQPVDERADIYALGATLFHVLTGQPPYAGLGLHQVLAQKLTADAPRAKSVVNDISDETDELVASMMARQPEQRIANYSVLLSLIEGRGWGSGPTTKAAIQLVNAAPIAASIDQANIATMQLSRSGLPNLVETPRSLVSGSTTSDSLGHGTIAVASTENLQAHTPIRESRRKWLATAIGAIGLIGASTAIWLAFWNSPQRVDRPEVLQPTEQSEPLFDGRSLRKWQPRSGTWTLAQDDDGASVLAGTSGLISRRFGRDKEAKSAEPTSFAITLAVRLHQANAVELQFGFLAGQDNGPRLALRVDRETAVIAARANDRGSPQPVTAPIPLKTNDAETPRVLRIVRGLKNWNAFLDDEFVGAYPLSQNLEVPEIRLFAESGFAWFSDIEWEELRAP